MDRPFWYYGPVLRDTDLLNASRYPMVGVGKLAEATLGANTVVAGFAVAPTVPASMSITIGAGQVYQTSNLESTQWAAFGPDTHAIVKQGISLDSQNETFVAPTTVGYAQNFLVQVAYADQDGGSTLLPYYNAAAPTQPFSGPGNSGTAQNTVRAGVPNITIKAGIAAASGTQTTPAPDSGYVGLYIVTISQGQTTITAGNITAYAPSSYLPTTLPGVPSGVQNGQWVFGASSGTNIYAVTLFSTNQYPFTLTTGMEILVYFGSANTATTGLTLNASGSGAKAIVKQGGGAPGVGDLTGFIPIIYDGTNWRINGLVTSDVIALISSVTRINLTSNLTVYVRTDGSDTNNGLANTSAGAFATIEGAVSSLLGKYNFAGFTATICLGIPGTYAGFIVPNYGVSGQINVTTQTVNQSAYIITPLLFGSVYSCAVSAIQTLQIDGVTLDGSSISGSQVGALVRVTPGGQITLASVALKYSGTNNSVSMVSVEAGGTFSRVNDITVSGPGTISSVFNVSGVDLGCTVTVSTKNIACNSMTFGAFYFSRGKVSMQNTTYSGTGNVGSQYTVGLSGTIDNTSGPAYSTIPGNSAGTESDGGRVLGGTPWSAYAPVITTASGTLGSSSSGGLYKKDGRSVDVYAAVSIATVGSGSGLMFATLPFNSAGAFELSASDANGKSVVARANNSESRIYLNYYDTTSVITAGQTIYIQGRYQSSS